VALRRHIIRSAPTTISTRNLSSSSPWMRYLWRVNILVAYTYSLDLLATCTQLLNLFRSCPWMGWRVLCDSILYYYVHNIYCSSQPVSWESKRCVGELTVILNTTLQVYGRLLHNLSAFVHFNFITLWAHIWQCSIYMAFMLCRLNEGN